MKARIIKTGRVYTVEDHGGDDYVVLRIPHRVYSYDDLRTYRQDEVQLLEDHQSRGGKHYRRLGNV